MTCDDERMSSDDEQGLVAWLRSAILARKAAAEAATAAPWEAEGDDPTDDEVWIGLDDDSAIRLVILRGPESHQNMLHVAANDPRDTIARCEAELAILGELSAAVKRHEAERRDYANWVAGENLASQPALAGPSPGLIAGLERAVRLLAGGYRHHPGYRAEWAVTPGVPR